MSLQSYVGEIASLLTAVCWTFSAIYFEKAGRRGRVIVGKYYPDISWDNISGFNNNVYTWDVFSDGCYTLQLVLVRLSGIVGFFLGDLFLFKSYIIIGSRTSQLVMSLAPMITAVIGWFFLNEILS